MGRARMDRAGEWRCKSICRSPTCSKPRRSLRSGTSLRIALSEVERAMRHLDCASACRPWSSPRSGAFRRSMPSKSGRRRYACEPQQEYRPMPEQRIRRRSTVISDWREKMRWWVGSASPSIELYISPSWPFASRRFWHARYVTATSLPVGRPPVTRCEAWLRRAASPLRPSWRSTRWL